MTEKLEPMVEETDIAAALKHLGWDDYGEFCEWALSNHEMERFDELAQAFARHRASSHGPILEALEELVRVTSEALDPTAALAAARAVLKSAPTVRPSDDDDRIRKQFGIALEAVAAIAEGEDAPTNIAQQALDDITRIGMEALALSKGSVSG